jgi:hypothetical protein
VGCPAVMNACPVRLWLRCRRAWIVVHCPSFALAMRRNSSWFRVYSLCRLLDVAWYALLYTGSFFSVVCLVQW